MRRPHSPFGLLITVLLEAALACSLPIPSAIAPGETPDGTSPAGGETAAGASTVTTEADTELVAVIRQGETFALVALDGTPAGNLPATGLDWARPGRVQVLGDSVYYVDSGGSSLGGVVRRLTETGATELPFTTADLETTTCWTQSSGSRTGA